MRVAESVEVATEGFVSSDGRATFFRHHRVTFAELGIGFSSDTRRANGSTCFKDFGNAKQHPLHSPAVRHTSSQACTPVI